MIEISPYSPVPIYEQLITQIKKMVQEGKLKGKEALPPIRTLASQLGVAINTVARAYQELEKEGIIISNGRKGSFIREFNADKEDSTTKIFKGPIVILLQKGYDRKEIERIFHSNINQIFT